MSSDQSRPESPFNAIPPVPLALVLIIVGVEFYIQVMMFGFSNSPDGAGIRLRLLDSWAFVPSIIELVFGRGEFTLDLLKRFVTYPFLHGGFTHALWTSVLLLAMGKFVGEAYRPLPFLAIFFGSVIGGALIYGLVLQRNYPLVGAYPGVYGLIGAYTYMMWLTLGRMGENQFRAFTLIGVLMGITLVFSMFFGSSPWWIAEFSGFVIGLFIAPLVAPGGWRAFLKRLRDRR